MGRLATHDGLPKIDIPALEHLRLLKRMRDDPRDRVDLDYIDALRQRVRG